MEIISGEKFQRLADISVITPQIKKFEKNLKDINQLIFPEFDVIIKSRIYSYIKKIGKSSLYLHLPFIIKKIWILLKIHFKINRFSSKEKTINIIINNLIKIPNSIKNAKIIFVYTQLLDSFFSYIYPSLQQRFILITHNSDYSISKKYNKYLNDNKILKWYGQNCVTSHPKLIPLPIGIANNRWPHGDEKLLREVIQNNRERKKKNKAFANFKIKTNRKYRQKVYDIIENNKFVIKKKRKGYYKYLEDFAGFKYSIVPKGNGQDCHRLWESLYLDIIPIIDDNKLFKNFTTGIWEGTPIILIKDWKKFSEKFVIKEERKMIIKNKWREKLDFKYWQNLIETDIKEY